MPNVRPGVVQQYQHAYPAMGQVLLMPDALITGPKDFVAIFLGSIEQVSVAKSLPSSFPGSIHFVERQMAPERGWDIVVEEYS